MTMVSIEEYNEAQGYMKYYNFLEDYQNEALNKLMTLKEGRKIQKAKKSSSEDL